MAPRQNRSNRLPNWKRESPFFNEINSLEAFDLLSVPAQDSQMLNQAVDEWEKLDPVVKDYLNARMQYQMISAFNLLRQRMDRAIDHLGSIRTGTRLIEAQGRPPEPVAPFGDDGMGDDGMDDADHADDDDGFESPEDMAFVEAARGQIGDEDPDPQDEGDTFVLDHDPWADNGGGAPVMDMMEGDEVFPDEEIEAAPPPPRKKPAKKAPKKAPKKRAKKRQAAVEVVIDPDTGEPSRS